MRILHVISSIDPSTGGPAEGLKQYCNIYQSGGHEVEVASLDSPASVNKYSFPATVVGLGPGIGVYGYTRRAVPWLINNLFRFDLAIINGIWNYNTLAAYRACTRSGVPYAVFTHGMLDPYFKKRYPLKHLKKILYWHSVLQNILHNASAVFFTSEEEKLLARQSFPGHKVREIVVPYGTFGPDCDTEEAAQKFLSRWPHLRGKRLALCLGRIHPKKAIDILIEAFAGTLAQDPAWHLVLAGPDQSGWQNDLVALARRLNVSDRITWTGMLNGTLKWGSYSASEIFVLPSHQENFGIVVAEALACGLPAIISDKVNIWREVMSYWAGLICDDTIDGTKGALVRWSQLTEQEIVDVRLRSKKCFAELFDFKTSSVKILDIIKLLAQNNGRRSTKSDPTSAQSRK